MKKKHRIIASIMAYKWPTMKEPLIVLENRTVKKKRKRWRKDKKFDLDQNCVP